MTCGLFARRLISAAAALVMVITASACAIRPEPVASVVPTHTAGTAASGSTPSSEASQQSQVTLGDFAATQFSDAAVIDSYFADPDVLRVGDTYYAYATNAHRKAVQVATSTNLLNWAILPVDAMPVHPSWALRNGATWAPEVVQLEPGRFTLYFTATDRRTRLQCIGLAESSSPIGPFTAVGDRMFVCPAELGGAIDASTFRDDDGTSYLIWKTNGNCCGIPPRIEFAALSADGRTLIGPPREIFGATLDWETGNVEAPTIMERDGTYHLFYSASDYTRSAYSIGHASATSLVGPWTKDCDPTLSSTPQLGLYGPGGQDVLTDSSGRWVLFLASWDATLAYRAMHVFPLEWARDQPYVPGIAMRAKEVQGTVDCHPQDPAAPSASGQTR